MPNYDVLIAEWQAVQPYVQRASNVSFKGMISRANVFEGYETHRRQLVEQGYKFGTGTDRSFFERLDRVVLRDTPKADMGRVVFDEIKNILDGINRGCKPKPSGSFSILVMMDVKYTSPLANLVFLVTSKYATSDDLALFWQLTDRLWSFGHPTQTLHSWYLDETCDRISNRFAQVKALERWELLRWNFKKIFPVTDFWLKQPYKPEGTGQKRRREEYEREGFA